MTRYKELILNKLLDKYENSKSFTADNKVNQRFYIHLAKEFSEYADDAKVNEIRAIDNAVLELEDLGLVYKKKKRNGLLEGVQLNLTSLDDCYKYLSRTPKRSINSELELLLFKYADGDEIVSDFCKEQLKRLKDNKKIAHFSGSISDYEDLLKALSLITGVSQETYVRDFSIKVFGDSKKFEKIRSTLVSILYEYGDFPDKGTVLEDLNIIKNPGHVYFKGAGIIDLAGQIIDISKLNGDVAISSSMLKDINNIIVTGDAVVTIENLTTFNMYKKANSFVIYLGGYLNSVRGDFIKRIYSQNPHIKYYHYGDIDAGGFYILRHLRNKTGVYFEPLHMDIETLAANTKYAKGLSDNDRKRLGLMQDSEFKDVIQYMLANNCKLEQEALDLKL